MKATPGSTRLYKMHGSVDRLDDIVISTDDYELFRSKRGAFLPLLQAHLTSMSMLFVGLSFTDPNVKHVLSLIRESFTDAPPEHFAIVRPPKQADFRAKEEFTARETQHKLWAKDLRRYGLIAIEIDDYDEIPELLLLIERRVAERRIWISGSWPIDGEDAKAAQIYYLAEQLGRLIGESGLNLVSGAGVLVGSAAISGFLSALRFTGGWDLDHRLVARPFPQPLQGAEPNRSEWTTLRKELARQAGVVIFLGGSKVVDGQQITSDGVLEEFALAQAAGAFLLPIGFAGGAAQAIFEELRGSNISVDGPQARRPTDKELTMLADPNASAESILDLVAKILGRLGPTK